LSYGPEIRRRDSLPHAHQQFHRQLIEPLVGQRGSGQINAIEGSVEQLGGVGFGIFGGQAGKGRVLNVDGFDDLLDFAVGVPACGLFLEDHVRAYAAAGKFLDVGVIALAIGMGVEMARAVVLVVFQQFDEEEGVFEVGAAEAQILIVSAEFLIVEVDVEKFFGFDGGGDLVNEIQTGHVFVRHLRIDAAHLRMVEGGDERQVAAGNGEIDMAARLVGLGLEGEFVSESPVDAVLAEEVDGFAEALDGFDGGFGGVGFGAFAAAPEDVNLRAAFGAEFHGPHGFLDGIGADLGVVAGERAVFEDRIAEEVGGGHGDEKAVGIEGLFEIPDDLIALGACGVDGDEVVVVEIDAVRADLAEEVANLDGRKLGADGPTERIAADVADGPQAKGEFQFRIGLVLVGHIEKSWKRGTALLCKRGYDATGMQTEYVQVKIDLGRVRENAAAIARQTGVDVIAVVKSDAYGVGARRVAEAIGDLVSEFCVFSVAEARAASLWDVAQKPSMALGPAIGVGVRELAEAHVRPAVWTAEEARRLRDARPLLCVDTGMRRFACPPDQIDAVIAAGGIHEAFTHATRIEHVRLLVSLVGGRGLRVHAAASALLNEPEAYLNAVRPGMAIYRGAVRVSTRLVELHDGGVPAGYGGFVADCFGVILCGYSHGLRRGPCLVNGARRSILEVGMQSAFVEAGSNDRNGDEVVLLGDGLAEAEIARAWGSSEQQVLVALTGAGTRTYQKG
jgi:alanine racemase